MPAPPPTTPKSGRRSKTPKIANRLMALSSAAVLTIYAAGYLRTQSAAEKLEAASAERRPARQAWAPAAPVTLTALRAVEAAALPTGAEGTQPIPKAAPRSAPAPAAVSESPLPTPAAVTAVPGTAPTDAAAPATTPATAPTSAAAERPTAEAPAPPPTPPQPQYKDGTYLGWGTSRHGDIQASVVIESGRIASATIAQCLTRYSCSRIAHLQGQVVSRQSPEVDFVSGATQSTNAFYYAVVEALSKAR